MGVPRSPLPSWGDLQILTVQLAHKPLVDVAHVVSELVIGPIAENPLVLDISILDRDMSIGALSDEAKEALKKARTLHLQESVP